MSEYEIELYKIIGEKLREIRTLNKITLEQVADVLQVIPKTVQRYETGERKIKINTIMQLSDYFGFDYDKFMTESKMQLIARQNFKNDSRTYEDKDNNVLYLKDKDSIYGADSRNNKFNQTYRKLNPENRDRLLEYAKKLLQLQKLEEPVLNAANEIHDATPGDRAHDDAIMDDENF